MTKALCEGFAAVRENDTSGIGGKKVWTSGGGFIGDIRFFEPCESASSQVTPQSKRPCRLRTEWANHRGNIGG